MTTPTTIEMVVTDLGPNGIELSWDSERSTDPHIPKKVAHSLGLHPWRELFQMRRPLPVPEDHDCRQGLRSIDTRSFRLGSDGTKWVRQNNLAFSSHPSQGSQTLETLGETLAEPWVDLNGFLVVDDPESPDRILGSCWTRIHKATDSDPALGEIFVIGVDPAHNSKGYGRALVLAGLDHLSDMEISNAMLWVEADNKAALSLYESLGFEIVKLRRIYR